MSAATHHFIVAFASIGALAFAAKALRHADEARALIGPTARAVAEEVRGAAIPPDAAVTAAQAASEAREQ